jgi:hypothetical protein
MRGCGGGGGGGSGGEAAPFSSLYAFYHAPIAGANLCVGLSLHLIVGTPVHGFCRV